MRDCVPCIKRKGTCDHARPRCTACARAGLHCTRSTAKFTWKPGFTLTRKPFRKRRAAWSRSRKNDCTFILEDPAAVVANHDSTAIVRAQGATFCPAPTLQHGQYSEQECSSNTTPILAIATCSYPAMSGSATSPLDTTLSHPVLFSSLAERYQTILDQYDFEFCQIPLTYGMLVNPFQCELKARRAPSSLLHAIMALAGHHLDNAEGEVHRQTAVHNLHEGLGHLESGEVSNALKLLHTILLLFSLDETRSAFGCWSMHLRGAFSLLEASGGTESWTRSKLTIAQVGLLTWWDGVIGLMSRQGCVFPYTYFENVLKWHNEKDWTFLGLCGCPRDLAVSAIQLAHLAAEKVKTITMRFVVFDKDAVRSIQTSLKAWCHTTPPEAWTDNETMEHDVDKMHCSEAWRHGLLLYIFRVFLWIPGESATVEVAYHTRQILDHVFACRDAGYLAKQAVFPLFLAGCEVTNESHRKRIACFCSYWSKKTRYFMIDSVMPLLREIWAAQDAHGAKNVSWWTVVDQWHTQNSGACDGLPSTFCFG